MAQKNTKARMVSFRLSSGEYEAALATCHAQGFKSMSRLAKTAFLAYSPGLQSEATHENGLTDIRQRIEYLTDELNRLAAVVAAIAPAAAP
jgi:hypothetical protein